MRCLGTGGRGHGGFGALLVLVPATSLSPGIPLPAGSGHEDAGRRLMNSFVRLTAPKKYDVSRTADVARLALRDAGAAHHVRVMTSFAATSEVNRAQLKHALSAAQKSNGLVDRLYLATKLNDYAIARTCEMEKSKVSRSHLRKARLASALRDIPRRADRQLARWQRRWDMEESDDEDDEEEKIAEPSRRRPKEKTPRDKKEKGASAELATLLKNLVS